MNRILTSILGLTAVLSSATVAAADVGLLESGTYFAQGSMYSRSYRVVRKDHDGAGRACVKIVDGPPNPYEGYQQITISTLVSRSDNQSVVNQSVVTATQADFMVRGPQEFVIGSGQAGVWRLAKNLEVDLSAGVTDCLRAQGRYAKQWRGPFVAGRIEPPVPGELVTRQAKARVNVRKEAGATSSIAHYGLGGDKVMLMESRRDLAQQIWVRVTFMGSGAEGWVRNDLVRAPGRPGI